MKEWTILFIAIGLMELAVMIYLPLYSRYHLRRFKTDCEKVIKETQIARITSIQPFSSIPNTLLAVTPRAGWPDFIEIEDKEL